VLFNIQMSDSFLKKNTPEISDKMFCESCGKEFSCGEKAGKCWCFEVELKTETLADLREDFKNCLCKDCLELKSNITEIK